MPRRSYGDRAVSPNQEFRRDEILAAAGELLRTGGVGACTVRAVAERAGVSNGVIHYYFAGAQELVDLAFARLATEFYAHVRAIAEATDPPELALWRMVLAYVMPWDAHSSMTLLWCEYYAAGARAGRLDGVRAAHDAMRELFEGGLARISPDARRHATSVTRHITGAVLTQPQLPVDPVELVAEIARLVGRPAPAAALDPACPDQDCRFHRSPALRE
ncbi:MAG: TetR family transcriptional regulator, partial [Actinomycetota bacterium]|nr:TetR family transcriptional regulator [Actinomycetota bacterium]